MTRRVVYVDAPSRLHFGMLSVNQPGTRQYGGVGAMVASPGVHLKIEPAERLETAGLFPRRTARLARLTTAAESDPPGEHAPRCRIEVTGASRQHVGLGTGTQLAMAVAAGLRAWQGRPSLAPQTLARQVARGQRSAIGLYGFAHGGLLYEEGKSGSEVAPLVDRVALPETWRFVLICPRRGEGLSGTAEERAFSRLPPVPPGRSDALRREVREVLLPAAAEGRFRAFGESLYRFGYEAGLSFAVCQGGAFAGRRLTALVRWIRGRGIRGAGQSSWGPTLFALLENEAAAEEFAQWVRHRPDGEELETTVAAPNNRGVQVRLMEE